MNSFQIFFLLTTLSFSINTALSEEKDHIAIANFSSGNLIDWKSKSFSGKTDYKISPIDQSFALQAISHSSASGLYKEQRIDLNKTPFLNWRWRINSPLIGLDEQSKSGDDFSARVYIIVNGGWFFWQTKAINYVWAGNTEKNTLWPNAFVGKKAMMIALRSSKDKSATWYTEKRNIQKDFAKVFGSNIRYIDAIALMTDTDNSQSKVQAYYGDIYFSAK